MHAQLMLHSDMVAHIPFKFLNHFFVLLDDDDRGRGGLICSEIRIEQNLSIEFKAMLVRGLQMMADGWLFHKSEILG